MADEYLYDKKPKIFKYIRKAIFLIIESAAVVVVAWLIVNFLLEKTIMVDDSMMNTLNNGDVLIVNKIAYIRKNPSRHDVIVFNQGKNEHSYYNVKRIIGVPGDSLEIVGGEVFINGERLNEKVKVDEMRISGLAATTIVLGDNEYFVLGDNRNNSEDSRFSNIGMIVSDDIIGKVAYRISPEIAIVDKLNLK